MALLSGIIQKQRYAQIASYIRGDVLELGCGSGSYLLTNYSSSIGSYCGVERSARQIERLRERHPGFAFFQLDLDRDPLSLDQKFDCVMMIALIEHLFNQRFVMDQIARVLKPGGIVVITTPTPFGNDLVHRLGAGIGLFAKSAVDDHIVIYNRLRFGILADETGLHLKHHEYFQLRCNQMAILEKPGN